MPSDWLLLLLPLSSLVAAVGSWRLHRAQDDLAENLVCASLRYLDATRAHDSMARLATAQQLTEAVVEGGAATVQVVHKGIARIPFGILESIPVIRRPSRLVRGIHDLTANSVYDAIRSINRALGQRIRQGLMGTAPVTPSDVSPAKTGAGGGAEKPQ